MNYLHLHSWNGKDSQSVPILALHGFTGSGLDFECFTYNTLQNFSWFAPDLMGHGQTPISENERDYSFDAHIDYLDLISKQLKKPFILLGYSMGGRLALKYALERPHNLKHLILASGTPGIIDRDERLQRQQADEALASKILSEGVHNFINFWQEQDIIRSQKNIPLSIYEPLLKRKFANNALGLANSLRKMGTGSMESLWHQLCEIEIPVTLITGEKDLKFTQIAEQMSLYLRNASHIIFPNIGHAAIWENPDYFIKILNSLD